MNTCLDCGRIFKNDILLGEYNSCPILECNGEVVDIDDNILETILLLNQKGYPTKFCCSGHTWGGDPYILFEDGITERTFESLPNDFITDPSPTDGLVIRKSISGTGKTDKLIALSEASIDLIKWADSLPASVYLSIHFYLPADVTLEDFSNELLKEFKLSSYEHTIVQESQLLLTIDMIVSSKKYKQLNTELREFANRHKAKLNIERF